jgi:hypothetical protein
MNWFRAIFNWLLRSPKSVFHGCAGQHILERYDDYKECGVWGYASANFDGTPNPDGGIKGKMMTRTVKYVDERGVVRLGSEWVPDSEIEKT